MSSEQEHLHPFPLIRPEVRGAASRMEETMKDPLLDDPSVPIEYANDLWLRGLISSYADFELGLRAVDSRVHLVATPPEMYEDISLYDIVYPILRSDPPRYVLSMSITGPEKAQELRRFILVTKDQNLERLKKTGFLVPKMR